MTAIHIFDYFNNHHGNKYFNPGFGGKHTRQGMTSEGILIANYGNLLEEKTI
jgi:hypothetical protein